MHCNCRHRSVVFRIIDKDVPKQNSSVLKMLTNLGTTTFFSAVTEGNGKQQKLNLPLCMPCSYIECKDRARLILNLGTEDELDKIQSTAPNTPGRFKQPILQA